MSALRIGADRPWRSQEHSADGRAASTWRYDQLHHFVAAGVWAATSVETELLVQADKGDNGSLTRRYCVFDLYPSGLTKFVKRSATTLPVSQPIRGTSHGGNLNFCASDALMLMEERRAT
jgi:hypothetical protein